MATPAPAKPFSWSYFIWQLVVVLLVCGLVFAVYLDARVRGRFENHRWSLPAKVFARPLELYVGQKLAPGQLQYELRQLGYRAVKKVQKAGQYHWHGNQIEIFSRGFYFADSTLDAAHVRIDVIDNQVRGLFNPMAQGTHLLRLEPQLIGGIYPSHNEDRMLIQLQDLPNGFLQVLLAVEDRHYYQHLGVSPRAIGRAIYANIKSGRVVQGGSTLTQQLVKNFYLTYEQSWWRKLLEMPMALLLNSHYSKDAILEVYLNEVFLGQQGKRAIHGFGLASWFYFGQPLNELRLHQVALLVGMVKGPSYYNPKRFPKRAKHRRDLVLRVLAEQGLISHKQSQQYQALPLQLSKVQQFNRYPAYMDVLRQQLQKTYKNKDLTTAGLRIFTSLDPWAQHQADQAMKTVVKQLQQRHGGLSKLQGALVLSRRGNGEILAIVGDRDAGYAGHNWALDDSRQIGSLLKPVIHLTALTGDRYHLLSPLSDAPLSVPQADGGVWQPSNYDGTHHGQAPTYQVPMYEALVQSYNLANVRLGMDVGVAKVLHQFAQLGGKANLVPYPSRLLGAVEMSPLAVGQVYQSIAGNGFYSPLTLVRAVTNAPGTLLAHYPYEVHQVADSKAIYLLQQALTLVSKQGTARGVYRRLPAQQVVVGKTGTTNVQRDSWFAGFSGRHVATVWLGNADASPTPLTGASGALQVWAELMANLAYQVDKDKPPAGVTFYPTQFAYTNPSSGVIVDPGCQDVVMLPFAQSRPPVQQQCGE